jgi:molybdenum cofactor cytidylyltransferase
MNSPARPAPAANRPALATNTPAPAATRPALRIIVLAAGFSSRLGKPKALARVRGISLIDRTLRVLAPLAGASIIVVVPPRAARLRAELRAHRAIFAENPHRGDGLSSSVQRGLREARHGAGVLFVPVDLPYLERRDIERLIARWRGARRCVAARRIGGRRIGDSAAAPLILPRRLYPRAVGIAGDIGLKELVRDLPRGEVALVTLASAHFDVDTGRDLERARRHPRVR